MSLDLEDVTVTVPDGEETLTILDDLSLQVDAGEVVTLTGASGSGKSTLLSIAGLLRRPSSGSVRIGGIDAMSLSAKRRTRLRGSSIGLVFQASNLFPSLTALEQVELVAHIAGRLDADAKRRARELLVEVGLGDRLDRRPAHLSGGERQRVGVARALMNEPTLLLADEPTASLDPKRGREVMDILVSEAVERGLATLIVTHVPEQLDGVTRSLRLEGGKVVVADPVGGV